MNNDVNLFNGLRDNLLNIGLSQEATSWLCGLWAAIQIADDIKDKDKPSSIERLLHLVMVDLPREPFYDRNRERLIAHVSSAIMAWSGANAYEQGHYPRTKSFDAIFFTWRVFFFNVVVDCYAIEKGSMAAIGRSEYIMMTLCAEDYDTWAKEMECNE